MEIDYSRFQEFKKTLKPGDIPAYFTWTERMRYIDDLYAQWLSQQRKPRHLEFEVKV